MNPATATDVPFELQDRWQTIARPAWTSSTAVGGLLYENDNIPSTLFHTQTGGSYVNNPLVRYIGSFREFYADIEVRITIQGNQNAFGSIMVATSADPGRVANYYGYHADPRKVFMFASDPSTANMFIPFKLPTYAELPVQSLAWGRFAIFVNAPLRNASTGAPPQLSILVEARLRNAKVKFPTNRIVYQSKALLKEASKVSNGNMLSAGVKYAGAVAFKTVKNLSGAVHPLLPAALDLLPFHRPIDASNVVRAHAVDTDVFSHVTGSTMSRRMGLAPVCPMPPLVGIEDKDYSEFSNYLEMSSHVLNFDVPVATAPDAALASLSVAPHFCPMISDDTHNYFYTGPMQFTASHFTAWRGSLKYQVQINCPPGASFQMRITWDTVPLTSVHSIDSGNVSNLVVAVKGNTVVEFLVPYASRRAWAYIPANFNVDWTSSNSRYQTSGALTFTKITNVLSPYAENVVPHVSVKVSAGPDLVFANPVADVLNTIEYQSKPTPAYIVTSDVLQEDCAAFTDKLTTWKEYFMIGRDTVSTGTFGPLISPTLRYAFLAYRGSTRHVFRSATEGYVRRNPIGPFSSSRFGITHMYYDADRRVTIEVPYLAANPWSYVAEPNPTFGSETVTASSASSTELFSWTDDLQLFFPTPTPTIKVPKAYA